ncbi:hypothetical protein M514_01343, partial [Trichuris suis]
LICGLTRGFCLIIVRRTKLLHPVLPAIVPKATMCALKVILSLFIIFLHTSHSKSIMKPRDVSKPQEENVKFNPQVDVAIIPSKEDAQFVPPAESILAKGKLPLRPSSIPSRGHLSPARGSNEDQHRLPGSGSAVTRPYTVGNNFYDNFGSYETGRGSYRSWEVQHRPPYGRFPPGSLGSSLETGIRRPFGSAELESRRPLRPGERGSYPLTSVGSSLEYSRRPSTAGMMPSRRPYSPQPNGRYPSSYGGSSLESGRYGPSAPVRFPGQIDRYGGRYHYPSAQEGSGKFYDRVPFGVNQPFDSSQSVWIDGRA